VRYFFGAADDDIDVIVRKMDVIESAEIHELNKNISIYPGWDKSFLDGNVNLSRMG
jgi:hypothetical protein